MHLHKVCLLYEWTYLILDVAHVRENAHMDAKYMYIARMKYDVLAGQ